MAVLGPFGIVSIGLHMYGAWHRETAVALARDLAWLTERTAQWMAAGLALWAVARRRAFGRWLAAGVTVYVAMKAMPGLWEALRALFGHPDTRTGALRFTSAAEGFGGTLFLLPIVGGLVVLGLRLALAEDVREYFLPAGEESGSQ